MTKWAKAEYPGRGRQKYHVRSRHFLGALCGVTLVRYGTTETPTGKLCRACVALAAEESE